MKSAEVATWTVTSPSGTIPRVRSAVESNESNARRPQESPTKNLVPSSFAGHHLGSIRKGAGAVVGDIIRSHIKPRPLNSGLRLSLLDLASFLLLLCLALWGSVRALLLILQLLQSSTMFLLPFLRRELEKPNLKSAKYQDATRERFFRAVQLLRGDCHERRWCVS